MTDKSEIEKLEDSCLARLSDEAVAKMKRSGHKPIPYEELKKEVEYKEIVTEDRLFILSEPLYCIVSEENGRVVIENKKLGVVVCAEDTASAENKFHEYFAEQYNDLAHESNEGLADDAQEVKKFLLSIVSEIRHGEIR